MIEDLIERLRNTSNMINMGEKISWGQDTALMDEAAAEIERLRTKLAEAEEHLANAMGHINTPIARRKLGIPAGEPWLRAAAEWMEKGDE